MVIDSFKLLHPHFLWAQWKQTLSLWEAIYKIPPKVFCLTKCPFLNELPWPGNIESDVSKLETCTYFCGPGPRSGWSFLEFAGWNLLRRVCVCLKREAWSTRYRKTVSICHCNQEAWLLANPFQMLHLCCLPLLPHLSPVTGFLLQDSTLRSCSLWRTSSKFSKSPQFLIPTSPL